MTCRKSWRKRSSRWFGSSALREWVYTSVTQDPLDLPEIILGQLGNRVQHALRAFTPRDQKNVKAAAETFRANPKLECSQSDHPAGSGRGAGVRAGRKGISHYRGAGFDPSPPQPAQPSNSGGTFERSSGDRPSTAIMKRPWTGNLLLKSSRPGPKREKWKRRRPFPLNVEPLPSDLRWKISWEPWPRVRPMPSAARLGGKSSGGSSAPCLGAAGSVKRREVGYLLIPRVNLLFAK